MTVVYYSSYNRSINIEARFLRFKYLSNDHKVSAQSHHVLEYIRRICDKTLGAQTYDSAVVMAEKHNSLQS